MAPVSLSNVPALRVILVHCEWNVNFCHVTSIINLELDLKDFFCMLPCTFLLLRSWGKPQGNY